MEPQKQIDVISILKSFKTDPFYEQWERLRAERRGQGSINFFFTFISKTLIDDLRAKYGEKEIETTLAVPYMLTMERLALDYGKTKYDLAFLIPVAWRNGLVIDNKMYIMKDVEILRFFKDIDLAEALSVFSENQEKFRKKYPELTEYINSPNMSKYFWDVDDAIAFGKDSLAKGGGEGQTRRPLELSLVFKNTDGKFYEFSFATMYIFKYYSGSLMVVKGKLDLW